MKYGLKPVLTQPAISLSNYYTVGLPAVESLPDTFGHADKIQPHMYLNDVLGCCAIAGSIEEVRLLNACRGVTLNFTDYQAVQNYSAVTGYEPGPELTVENGVVVAENHDEPPNPTDGGADVHELFDYRQSTGIVDADGKYHKVVGYAGLTPGDWDELLVALYLFDVVAIGIHVPDYAQQQFADGQPWDVEDGDPNIEGGHYIPVAGRANATEVDVFTWGAVQGMTQAFYEAFNMVAVVALTEEMFTEGKTIDGIDQAQLGTDLHALNTGRVSTRAPKAA